MTFDEIRQEALDQGFDVYQQSSPPWYWVFVSPSDPPYVTPEPQSDRELDNLVWALGSRGLRKPS